jgi:uncharacterized BrkB/YihY/UPF0761 family membrane protein
MKSEIIEKLAVLVTGAFGLVAALAWNSAVQAIFKEIFREQSSILAMLIYAVLVTALAVIITIWISKISDKSKKQAKSS